MIRPMPGLVDAQKAVARRHLGAAIEVRVGLPAQPHRAGKQRVRRIFAVGFLMAKDLDESAARFPQRRFAIIDAVVDQPNVASVTFREEDGSFLAGAAAAMVSKTHQIAFLGGIDIPLLRKFEAGFTAGAREIDPNIKVAVKYVGSFDDAAAGKELSGVLFDQGADIVFVAAGKAGIGAIDQVKTRPNDYIIGVDSDQDALAPGKVLTSMIKRVDVGVFRLAQETVAPKTAQRSHRPGPQRERRRLTPSRTPRTCMTPERIAPDRRAFAPPSSPARSSRPRRARSWRSSSRCRSDDDERRAWLRRLCACAGSANASAAIRRSTASTSTLCRAKFTRSSAKTAPANRPWRRSHTVRSIPDAGTIEAHGTVGLVHQHFQLDRAAARVGEHPARPRTRARSGASTATGARANGARAFGRGTGWQVDPDAARRDAADRHANSASNCCANSCASRASLLLDEPTAALAPTEIDAFFVTVRALAEARHGGLDRHPQARRGDRLQRARHRDAQREESWPTFAPPRPALPRSRAPWSAAKSPHSQRGPRRRRRGGWKSVRCAQAAGAGAMANASLLVRAGEIVGIAGIEGNGQTQLADAIGGVVPYSGEIVLDGTLLPPGESPAAAHRARHSHHPARPPPRSAGAGLERDRQRRAGPAARSAAAPRRGDRPRRRPALRRRCHRTLRRPAAQPAKRSSARCRAEISRRSSSAGPWREAPAVVVAYQPTRGIDIGAATLVGSRLIEARNAGAAVLLISFELDEIFALADRVYVMFGGTFVGEFDRAAIDRGRIGALMAGG